MTDAGHGSRHRRHRAAGLVFGIATLARSGAFDLDVGGPLFATRRAAVGRTG